MRWGKINAHGPRSFLVVICAAEVMQHCGSMEQTADRPPSGFSDDGEYKFEEVIGVTDDDADDVNSGRVTQDHGKRQEDPREIRCGEREKIQEGQPDVFVLSPPDVDHHEGEGGAEEGDRGTDEGRDARNHRGPEQNHEDEISRTSAEGAFF